MAFTTAENSVWRAYVPRFRRRSVMFALLVLALLLGAAFFAGRIARERAAADLANRAAAALPLAGASLAALIEKQRLVPTVLVRDPEIIAMLEAPDDHARDLLDAKLAEIAAEANAAVIYLVDRNGLSIAASNAGKPDSFLDRDYSFRSYFADAMAQGTAQQYALGTISGRPGLYLSRRVETASGPAGVVVVKVEFDDIEARWRASGLVVQVTDQTGVVLATTNPAWRFGTTRPLADEAGVRTALQLGDTPLSQVPVTIKEEGLARIDGRSYIMASDAVGPAAPGWRIAAFLLMEPALGAAVRGAQVTAMLAGLVVALAGYLILRRRRWAHARQTALAAMNTELERRVAERTEELNTSNVALAAEMVVREAAETRARRLREELAQANRLSILGQVTAGVAHEINQPLAAIRAYSEAGGRLLDAGLLTEARGNFREVVSVTERIGAITQALRGFSRRGTGQLRPVAVNEAIDGALTLLAGRIRDAGATILRDPVAGGEQVIAGRIRLEQILVNLLQNALDAVRDVDTPTIAIRVAATGKSVAISVEDNGPGVPQEVYDQLFMPFTTTKETGLGLGLVISGDLAREFGGELRLEPRGKGGATFTLVLPGAA